VLDSITARPLRPVHGRVRYMDEPVDELRILHRGAGFDDRAARAEARGDLKWRCGNPRADAFDDPGMVGIGLTVGDHELLTAQPPDDCIATAVLPEHGTDADQSLITDSMPPGVI
jgi:hypothetical protein